MTSIKENISRFEETLKPFNAKLVAVSKTKPVELIMEAYDAGFKRFGENKVQELSSKSETMPSDIEWHMIGHLQRNKVKYIAPFVNLIHSVDSERLLREINKQAAKADRTIPCLLQIHIAKESTKFGLSESELLEMLDSPSLRELKNVEIAGLMGMATFTEDESVIREEFRTLKNIIEKGKSFNDGSLLNLTELSMGMSNDYRIALEEGSTMIRVGSSIFGARS